MFMTSTVVHTLTIPNQHLHTQYLKLSMPQTGPVLPAYLPPTLINNTTVYVRNLGNVLKPYLPLLLFLPIHQICS